MTCVLMAKIVTVMFVTFQPSERDSKNINTAVLFFQTHNLSARRGDLGQKYIKRARPTAKKTDYGH